MYRSFYGFKEKPFSMTPDPNFLYVSKNHKEAFAHLLYGIRNKAGFIELTGEVGTGKTTVLRTLLAQLDRDKYRTALIFNPCLSALELLQNINREYGIPSDDVVNSKLIGSLNEFLLQENTAGRTVILVIDEAQNLEPAVLEQIRLISNLETEKDKLIQILLVAQPELETMLNKPEMRQLNQRITVHYRLKPMDYKDTIAYINHRLEVAGESGNGKIIFSPSALKRIFHYSRGFPRLINIACERALLAGYTKNAFVISRRMAASAVNDVARTTEARRIVRRLIPLGLLLIAALVGAGVYFSLFDTTNKTQLRKITFPDVLKMDHAMNVAEFSRAAGKERALYDEEENFLRTFNAIANLCNIPPLASDEKPLILEKAFEKRAFLLYRYKGNLGSLLRMDCPAIMELSVPGVQGIRYAALTGIESDGILIAPAILEKRSLTVAELETLWTGRSYIAWKNTQKIPLIRITGTSGMHVKSLQELLSKTGVYKGPLTAVFDEATKAAVKKFQTIQGIPADGIVGNQTMFLLYLQAGDRSAVPGLRKGVHGEAK